jgi:hypothetical protein
MAKSVIFFSLFLLLTILSSAFAQDDTGSYYYVDKPALPLCVDPGGSKRGELAVGAPVKVLEHKGDWVRVSVEGWVRETLLSKAAMSKDSVQVAAEKGDSPLVVAKYNAKPVENEGGEKRIALTLMLKNTTSATVSSWSGILVAIKDGKVLVREPLSQDRTSIAPGATGEASFYWDVSEKPYSVLKDSPADSLDFQLLKTKVN